MEFVYSILTRLMEPRQLLPLLNRANGLLSKAYKEKSSLGFYVSLPLAYTLG